MSKIGVIGAGAWGTALAQALAEAGRDVTLWAREDDVVTAINEQHDNTVFLPGVPLNKTIQATNDLSQAAACDILLLVTPAQHLRSTLVTLKNEITDKTPLVICSKGIEIKSGLLLSQVAEEEIPGATIAILTGPTFASEIARGLPSAVTIGAKSKDIAENIRSIVGTRTLRAYITDDMIGVQLGSAIKNVIAIASGIVIGRELGESARAALITRGLAEMARLSSAMGGKKQTLLGMCGVGDLTLTASSMQSRNYSLGMELGKGRTLDDILGPRKAVTEGVHTAKALAVMAKKHAVEMPICEAVNKCLNDGVDIAAAIEELLNRPLKSWHC